MSVPGGTGATLAASPEIQQIAEKVRAMLEQKAGRHFDKYEAIQYCSQVVAGINYFIKVQVGEAEYVHLRVYQDLQQAISLSNYLLNKTLQDPIQYF